MTAPQQNDQRPDEVQRLARLLREFLEGIIWLWTTGAILLLLLLTVPFLLAWLGIWKP